MKPGAALRPSNTATGNVFVDPAYTGLPREVSIPPEPSDEAREALAAWAKTCSSGGATAFVQLNHAGRQSQAGAGTRSIFAKTIAPSPVPLDLGPGILPDIARRLIFGTPREMTSADIELVVSQFAHSADVAAEAGFHGVVLHGAHGYLLAQFLSRKTNLRHDEWGGSAERRVRIVVEVIKRVRETTPEGFALGIKLNSADHHNVQDMEETLTQVKAIVEAGDDFIEISGGSWEDPKVRTHCPFDLTPLPSTATRLAIANRARR